MFEIVASTKFLKDLRLLKKRSIKDFQLLQEFITKLAETGHSDLDAKHKATNFRVILRILGMPC